MASPRRTRSSLVLGSRKSNSTARMMGTICHIEIGEYARAVVGQPCRWSFLLPTLLPTVRSFRQ